VEAIVAGVMGDDGIGPPGGKRCGQPRGADGK
jgi:hypothetical protein